MYMYLRLVSGRGRRTHRLHDSALNALQFLLFFLYLIFFITITNRDITKQTDQYLSQKNQEFNDLNKAVMETLYFCFLRYFSERCRETIILAIFLIVQSEFNAIPS